MRRRENGSVTIGIRLLRNRGRIGTNGEEPTERCVKQFWNRIQIVRMVPFISWLIFLFVVNRNKKIYLSIMRRRRSTSDSIGMRLIKKMTVFFIKIFASLVTSDEPIPLAKAKSSSLLQRISNSEAPRNGCGWDGASALLPPFRQDKTVCPSHRQQRVSLRLGPDTGSRSIDGQHIHPTDSEIVITMF